MKVRWRQIPLGLPLVILVWLLMGPLGLTHPIFFPDLLDVGAALYREIRDPAVWGDMIATSYRALLGLLISIVVGVPTGLLLGRSHGLYRHFALPLDFIRSIPAATLFPLFILIFGIGNLSKIAVVSYGCIFILMVAAMYGARATHDDDPRILALRCFRASKLQIYRYVIIPVAVENILSGLRIATSVAFVLVVITEMFLGANDGLGKRIYDMYLAYRVPEMYALLVLLGLLGFAANRAVEGVERAYKRRIGALP